MKDDASWIPTTTDLAWIDATSGEPHAALLAIEEAAEPENIPIVDRASGRVLAALAAGRATADVAADLGIPRPLVRAHVDAILEKLRARRASGPR
jgi:DNA-binding NarL/FixJ family response regulator